MMAKYMPDMTLKTALQDISSKEKQKLTEEVTAIIGKKKNNWTTLNIMARYSPQALLVLLWLIIQN